MSFQPPQNLPSFSSSQRPFEDSYWQSSRDSSGRLPGYGFSRSTGLPSKLNSFFDNDRALPMYKDKPYFAPRRTGPRSRRRRVLYGSVFVFVLIVIWYYGPGSGAWSGFESRRPDVATGEDLWKWVQSLDEEESISGKWSQRKSIDWVGRRERVRDAFIVSWDGYEKHAWGKKTSICFRRQTRLPCGGPSANCSMGRV